MSCTFFIVSADVLPQFWGDLSNVTVPVGREASFTCNIKNLGNYKVSQFFQESKLYNFFNVQNESQFSIMLNGAKVTRSTSAYALPLFLSRPKNQGKYNLSKVHSWEQPRNSFPHPVLTYHFLVPIGALAHVEFLMLSLQQQMIMLITNIIEKL